MVTVMEVYASMAHHRVLCSLGVNKGFQSRIRTVKVSLFIYLFECQSTWMSKIKNSRLDQYGAEPFEQQQLGTAGVEGVK